MGRTAFGQGTPSTILARDVRYFVMSVALFVLFVGGYVLVSELGSGGRAAAPPLAAPTTDGQGFDLADHRGRVVVVDFFATWCVPCRVVEDDLKQVDGSAEVVIVSVGADANEDLDTLRAYRDEHGLTWPVAKIDIATRDAWGVGGYPHVTVVDRDGRIVAVLGAAPGAPPPTRQAIEDAIARA